MESNDVAVRAKKDDLIRHMAEFAGIKKSQADKAYSALMDAMYDAILEDKVVRLTKIGTLSLKLRKPTTYCNPKTGEKIKVGAKKRVRFSPSEVIKTALAES